ncbi:MAG: ABC transporter substrate-binding protein [Actinomycetota bacterium]|nr:ABC transporter substrate-binding protein [Actinomycetota bacterium]
MTRRRHTGGRGTWPERVRRRARRAARAPGMLVVGAAVALLGTVSGCSQAAGTAAGPGSTAAVPLTVTFSPSGPITSDFNPYSATSGLNALGASSMLYEPLLQYDALRPGAVQPWLATGYTWSDGGRTLTFALRHGVTWSDGRPFTSADVAFTFALLRTSPVLAGGTVITSVAAPTPWTVVLTFPTPAYAELPAIASMYQLPKHGWQGVNPLTFTNPHPVGTGPYLLTSASSQGLVFDRNPHYWQPGLPKVPEIRFAVYDSVASANLALEHGQLQWTGEYIPEVQKQFVARDPAHNRYWSPTDGEAFLLTQDARYPFDITAVRQAISEAINRPAVVASGEEGLVPAATSPTGLALPLYRSFLAPQYASLTYHPDPGGAAALLASAGFHRTPGGTMLQPDGRPFDITMVAPSGWTDSLADYQVIAQQLSALGIHVAVNAVSLAEFVADVTEGTFDMVELPATGQPTVSPYYTYRFLLSSSYYQPIGHLALGNFERWSNPRTDTLLAQYAAAATPAARQVALDGLEQIMVDQVPVIPFAGAVAWGEYSTAHYVGWPSAANPYEVATPASPGNEVVVLHLRPR